MTTFTVGINHNKNFIPVDRVHILWNEFIRSCFVTGSICPRGLEWPLKVLYIRKVPKFSSPCFPSFLGWGGGGGLHRIIPKMSEAKIRPKKQIIFYNTIIGFTISTLISGWKVSRFGYLIFYIFFLLGLLHDRFNLLNIRKENYLVASFNFHI